MRDRNNDAFGLRCREAIVLQRLAQFREHVRNRIRYREGIGAVKIGMPLGLGEWQPENTPDDLLDGRRRACLLEAA